MIVTEDDCNGDWNDDWNYDCYGEYNDYGGHGD